MTDISSKIADRSIAYSLKIIELYRELERDNAGRVIGKRLLRSGTGIGAHLHEAQGGQSKADFIAKISTAHKEAYETVYWLKVINGARLLPRDYLSWFYNETEQIVKILSSILITAKHRQKAEDEK
ncbi:MAG: four helix bundle protein [FCB group bacterium]|nr:four helix bundle protein [FCB group bacterium]